MNLVIKCEESRRPRTCAQAYRLGRLRVVQLVRVRFHQSLQFAIFEMWGSTKKRRENASKHAHPHLTGLILLQVTHYAIHCKIFSTCNFHHLEATLVTVLVFLTRPKQLDMRPWNRAEKEVAWGGVKKSCSMSTTCFPRARSKSSQLPVLLLTPPPEPKIKANKK